MAFAVSTIPHPRVPQHADAFVHCLPAVVHTIHAVAERGSPAFREACCARLGVGSLDELQEELSDRLANLFMRGGGADGE